METYDQGIQWTGLLVAFLFLLLVCGLLADAATKLEQWIHRRHHYHRRKTDMPLKYDNALCNQFLEDMQSRGLEPFHYHGRFFYQGPAVDVDHLQEAMQHTSIPVQWDSLGLGFVVYPKASGKLIEESSDAAS